MDAREQVWEECRKIGEERVKQLINDRIYNRRKQTWAEEWLEAQIRLRSEASQSESLKIARSAKDAAWEAARAAKTANTIAALALAAAAIAIAISIVGIFVS
ncbi:MAG TPA: hypothetical protein VLA37_07995 [Sphingomonadaceae bacterium]|nr:hypothetical protein [Sphingomonadaceae bacterium]